MFNWILGQLRKGCRKIVYSWKSSEFESTESCEKAPRPQPNSVFAQFSVVCMFNWVLGQLREFVGRSYIRGKALNLNRLNSVREKAKPHPQLNSIIRAIPSYMCVQLDARPVKKGYREIVRSWKSSELKSAKPYEERKIS